MKIKGTFTVAILAIALILVFSIGIIPIKVAGALPPDTVQQTSACQGAGVAGCTGIAAFSASSTFGSQVTKGDSVIILGLLASGNVGSGALSCQISTSETVTTDLSYQDINGNNQALVICHFTATATETEIVQVSTSGSFGGIIMEDSYELQGFCCTDGALIITNHGTGNTSIVIPGTLQFQIGGWSGDASSRTCSATQQVDVNQCVNGGGIAVVEGGTVSVSVGDGGWGYALYQLCNPYCGVTSATDTATITGWVFPNYIDGTMSYSWFFGFIILFAPMAFVDMIFLSASKATGEELGRTIGLPYTSKEPVGLIFLTLVTLTIGSIVGVMTNFLPFAFPFIFGGLLAVYIWRGS